MLQSIPPQHKSDAIRLLQFIVHAKRPLTVSEAIEVVATHIDGEPRGFDVRGRLNREADILRICPGLVEIAQATKGNSTTKELHLTHYSIKEYLLREEQFGRQDASIAITRTCLTYLTDIREPTRRPQEISRWQNLPQKCGQGLRLRLRDQKILPERPSAFCKTTEPSSYGVGYTSLMYHGRMTRVLHMDQNYTMHV